MRTFAPRLPSPNLWIGLLLGFALSGCVTPPKVALWQPAPPLPSYHDLQRGIPIRRIAVLPLSHDSACSNFARGIDAAFYAELSKSSLFENVLVSREQMKAIFGREEFSSVEVLPGDLLAELRTRFGVDGILFTDITHYFPYQPISIGVRTKLVDARSGSIRWAFDYLFDSGKPRVAVAARHFYLGNTQSNLPLPATGEIVLESPLNFSRYAAWESYRSLLNQPPPPEAMQSGK